MLILTGEWGTEYLIKSMFQEIYDEHGDSVDKENHLTAP